MKKATKTEKVAPAPTTVAPAPVDNGVPKLETDPLITARTRAIILRPYFATALLALRFVPTPNMKQKALGPIGVDKFGRCYYDPEWVAQTDNEELTTVLFHEIGHLLHGHAHRCGDRNPAGFNIAGDMELNDDLAAEADLKLPKECVLPSTYELPDNLVAEQYYDMLKEKYQNEGHALADCGSVADGLRREWEHGDVQGNGSGENGEGGSVPEGVGQAEVELIKRDVAQKIKEALASGIGNIPAGWQRFADAILTPKVDYRRWIAAAVRNGYNMIKGKQDQTFRRAARRQAMYDRIIMPSMQQPIPRVSVLIDTSGSMSTDMLTQAVAEVHGVLKQIGNGADVSVASCDAAVHKIQKVWTSKEVQLFGGGGTDIGVGIATIDAQKPATDLLIIVTDCETPWPDKKPKAHITLTINVGNGAPPPWGKVINVATD